MSPSEWIPPPHFVVSPRFLFCRAILTARRNSGQLRRVFPNSRRFRLGRKLHREPVEARVRNTSAARERDFRHLFWAEIRSVGGAYHRADKCSLSSSKQPQGNETVWWNKDILAANSNSRIWGSWGGRCQDFE